MAVFSSTVYTGQLAGRTMTSAPGLRSALYSARAQIALTTALALADVLNFFYLPKDAVVEDMELIGDQLDSNGSPLLTFDIGDAASATRYFSAAVAGNAAGGFRDKMLQSAMGFQQADRTLIVGAVHAAGATKVAGNLTLIAYYKMPGNPIS